MVGDECPLPLGNHALAVCYGCDALGLDGWKPEGWAPCMQFQYHLAVCSVGNCMDVASALVLHLHFVM
jgi:hypothetical protein